MELDRRLFLAGTGAAALVAFGGTAFASAAPMEMRMWHSPGCGCCLEWANRLQAHFGRKLMVTEAQDMAAVKRANSVPAELQSCHTALIGGVVVEGHVPPADIRRLIAAGPGRFIGLSVPGMPAGAPGMDVGHNHKEPYKVYAFTRQGTRSVFATYG